MKTKKDAYILKINGNQITYKNNNKIHLSNIFRVEIWDNNGTQRKINVINNNMRCIMITIKKKYTNFSSYDDRPSNVYIQ